MHDVLLSKIAANATDIAWSQAYSTINFYLAISLSSDESGKSIAASGKETLERIQREFFALDEKNLETIKQAVQNGIEAHASSLSLSVILATILDSVLYIVTVNNAAAVLKRGEEVGIIAQGEENQVHGFSGLIQPHDVIVLETVGFAEKLPLDQLKPLLSTDNVTEISEVLTPLIHENSSGTEAALIMQYEGKPEPVQITREPEPDTPKEEPDDAPDEPLAKSQQEEVAQ